MNHSQQGFALVESMVAVVVFAILLIALLNYSQYITLNFNQIYQGSMGLRAMQGALETKNASIDLGSININQQPFVPQTTIAHFPRTGNCTESVVSLSVGQKQYSISRWYCAKGESHVSGISF
ncbi:Tfp pilus assembly protein PilV [Providencia rustigianii]|uniref:Prepilin-type cleavage/methylation N-terminal domain protein n=3 Tax=Providencia rustigianii TaxID=158850 RepID=D1P1F6_9GAMM|nr:MULTISPECIES: prepilin-type N-terminal cleavage/methylation domain-containing protein [Providencia]EFB72742.1 prepilin-type cleavage/methylation N-terminal domain protein [Providencia rustigianii DSM 4541]MTC56688.1 prepilin-type N-terminal cleavage/methylation domain-containing protein [Providencia rustigianii]MTC58942.1 prepilin-type N-terminal cleavage/methylation domain-containing protein [Providencia rustigianii]SPY78658.1 Tfp pilus assembly protein PilV [Providencia rustigianii]SUC283